MFFVYLCCFFKAFKQKTLEKTYPTFFPRAQILLGSTLIFTRFSFYARCAATLTAVSARDSGMVFAQPPQRNSQQTFLSLGAAMKSYSFLHSLSNFRLDYITRFFGCQFIRRKNTVFVLFFRYYSSISFFWFMLNPMSLLSTPSL